MNSNYGYMHSYYSNFGYIQTYAPTNVGVFLVKMCKTNLFFYFANLCKH